MDDKTQIALKFFIDDNSYHLYQYTKSEDDIVHFATNTSSLKKYNLFDCSIGDIIINYFNYNFDIIKDFFVSNNLSIEIVFDKLLKILEETAGIILGYLIFLDFFNQISLIFDLAYDKKDDYDITDTLNLEDYFIEALNNLQKNRDSLKELYNRFFKENDTNIFNIAHNNIQAIYEILPDMSTNQNKIPKAVYTINNLNTFIIFDLLKVIESKITINICKNCGKYFKPISKKNETLCNNIFRNNKSCRKLSSEIKLQNNKIDELYRKAYKSQHCKQMRYIDIADTSKKFNKWKNELINQKILCENGDISLQDFENWIKVSSKTWYNKN